MSKLLDLLDRIRDGAPAPLGFGVSRPEKLPGMALIGLVCKDHSAGVATVAQEGLDGAIVAGAGSLEEAKKAGDTLKNKPWGARVSSLNLEEAQAYQEGGADLLVFTLEGTSASALNNEEIGRVLCLDTNMEDRELRAVSSLPVDAYLLQLNQSADELTLSDLASVGSISRRSDKYILLEVTKAPNAKDLEALRDIGVHALLVDVDSITGDGLKDLKSALMDMPKPTFKRRDRAIALIPGSAFAPPQEPEPQEEEEEDE